MEFSCRYINYAPQNLYSMAHPHIEICFSPKLYEYRLIQNNFIGVVADIFRATTSICAAMDYGVESVIPVAGLEEAKKKKEEGYLVACERDGKVLDFADIGNSPSDFFVEKLKGQPIVFSTTNGTKAINLVAEEANEVLVGAFMNVNAIADHLIAKNENVVILCASWKNLFNLEDTLFGGALAEKLLEAGFKTECDSAKAAVDLWKVAKSDLPEYLRKSSHRNRLNHLLTEKDYLLSVSVNTSRTIPIFKDGELYPHIE